MQISLASAGLCKSQLYSFLMSLMRTFRFSANIRSSRQRSPPPSRHRVLSSIKCLYFHHGKHVTPVELREWHLKQEKGYWISSPWCAVEDADTFFLGEGVQVWVCAMCVRGGGAGVKLNAFFKALISITDEAGSDKAKQATLITSKHASPHVLDLICFWGEWCCCYDHMLDNVNSKQQQSLWHTALWLSLRVKACWKGMNDRKAMMIYVGNST